MSKRLQAIGADTSDDPAPSMRALALAALGVVYGDIGTSPLYTLREAFGDARHASQRGGRAGRPLAGVLGADHRWSRIKYVMLIMRADNHGEGGILALSTLARRAAARPIAAPTASSWRCRHRRRRAVLRRRR